MDIKTIVSTLKDHKPSIMDYEKLRKSAVLLPLIEKDGETQILFEVRSMKLRTQPGDICFPGGRIDKTDLSPKHAAIRETSEELGISASAIQHIIPLDYIVSDMGRIVYPFVGTLPNNVELNLNKAEVDSIFTVSLTYLLEAIPKSFKVHFQVKPEEHFPFDLIVGGKDYNWQMRHVDELFYQYDGKVIWGLTAKILTHFIELLRN